MVPTGKASPLAPMEEALNARLASIVEFSDDAIVGKDLEGVITSWNAGAEKLFGYTAEEVLGQPLGMLIPPERAAEEPQILARIARGEVTDHFETVRVRKDGQRIDVSVTVSPIKDARGVIIGASKIARDITERKRVERAIHRSEAKYRLLFETLTEGFCTIEMIFDAHGKPGNYRFLEVNPAFEKQTGLHNAHGKLMRDLAPYHEAHWYEIFGKVALTGEPVHFESEAKAVGRYYDVRAYRVGGPESRVLGILFSDITERRRTEQKLHAQLQGLHLLQHITRAIGERQDTQSIFQVVIGALEEQLPVDFCCICLYDAIENELTVTAVGTRSARLAVELAITEHARIPIDRNGLSRCVRGELIYEPQLDDIASAFAQRLVSGNLYAMTAAPLLVESKVFGALIAARHQARSFSSGECEFLRQLSEHVALAAHQAQLYRALQQTYDDLRQTQRAVMQHERLLALGQMASGIAHDINNAISPVALYTELLLDHEPDLSPRARGHLETMRRAIDDVTQTVTRIGEFARKREPEVLLLAVDLNQLVPQVIDLTRARWSDMAQQRGVAIEMRAELAPDLPAILGAESELREALINLIFNAVDAMPDGGPLIVRTKLVVDYAPGAGHPARTVQLEVIDSGGGMDEDTRRRCLEPFFTTKGAQGTGLGLATVYGTMQRHNADIEIDSTPGHGTTVRLTFAASGPPVVSAAPDSWPIPVVAPRRILLVDDDSFVIEALRATLAADGHSVTTAGGGQAGIDAFLAALAEGHTFRVVITDLGMPHVDGRQVASRIKAAAPETMVLLLTGWGQRLMADGDIPPDVDRVLSKPPKLRDLREALAYGA